MGVTVSIFSLMVVWWDEGRKGVNPTYNQSRPTDATLARPCWALAASRRPPQAAPGCARAIWGPQGGSDGQPTALSRTGGSQACFFEPWCSVVE